MALIICVNFDDVRRWSADPNSIPEPLRYINAGIAAEFREGDKDVDFSKVRMQDSVEIAEGAYGGVKGRIFLLPGIGYCTLEQVAEYFDRREKPFDHNRYHEAVRLCLASEGSHINPRSLTPTSSSVGRLLCRPY